MRGDAVFKAGVGGRLTVLRGEGIKKLFGQLAVLIGRVFDEQDSAVAVERIGVEIEKQVDRKIMIFECFGLV